MRMQDRARRLCAPGPLTPACCAGSRAPALRVRKRRRRAAFRHAERSLGLPLPRHHVQRPEAGGASRTHVRRPEGLVRRRIRIDRPARSARTERAPTFRRSSTQGTRRVCRRGSAWKPVAITPRLPAPTASTTEKSLSAAQSRTSTRGSTMRRDISGRRRMPFTAKSTRRSR